MRHEKLFFHRLQRWPFADVDMATPPAAQLTVAALPTPKTLESTLQLSSDVDEIPCYPQIAESAHGDIVAVWEQFDGAHYSIWGNSRRAHQGTPVASIARHSPRAA